MKKTSLGFRVWMCFLLGVPMLIYLSIIIDDHFFSPWAKLPASATEVYKPPFSIGINSSVIMKARLSKADFIGYAKKEGYTLGEQSDLERFRQSPGITDALYGPSWWTPPRNPEVIAYKESEYGMILISFKDGWLFYEASMFP